MPLKIYDVSIGDHRDATQEDIDQLQEFVFKIQTRPEGQLKTDADVRVEGFDFPLAVYPNRMRNDGVFVAEWKKIEPYSGVTDGDGNKIYPSMPDTPNRIGCQLPTKFAAELVRRWNFVK